MRPNRSLVLVFGSFDVLHLGHLHFFTQAKKHGSKLAVVVARDSSIKKNKGRKPFFSENERVKLVDSLKQVDKAVLGNRHDHHKIIKKIKPDVIVLGYDQLVDLKKLFEKLASFGLGTRVVRLKKGFKQKKHKSSKEKKFLEKNI